MRGEIHESKSVVPERKRREVRFDEKFTTSAIEIFNSIRFGDQIGLNNNKLGKPDCVGLTRRVEHELFTLFNNAKTKSIFSLANDS